ncbi:MAG TPA: N-formylglutamate amidohydrolase [Candidatus Ozemobacteraceae bacterium]|nr:N-formylglutamate amidohydrolase [Candidatus Ozemobacteraceae bacterium]
MSSSESYRQPPVVLHLPHSAVEIPPDVREKILLTDNELNKEILCMTDLYTDEIFALPEQQAVSIRYPVSRLVLDPERFLDDAHEEMAARGMGLVYTRTSRGENLRYPPGASEREELIRRFYHPHHDALRHAVERALSDHLNCLLIDCHSFPSRPLPYEADQRPDRPQICIGTDPFHTPYDLEQSAKKQFQACGWEVAINRPFAGALVPTPFFRQDYSVRAIMVEVNRGLYMNEATGAKLATFSHVAATIQQTIHLLIAEFPFT